MKIRTAIGFMVMFATLFTASVSSAYSPAVVGNFAMPTAQALTAQALTAQVVQEEKQDWLFNNKDVIANSGWQFNAIDYFEGAEILGKGSKKIKVAVVDGGIDCSAPALKDSVAYHYDSLTDTEIPHTTDCTWGAENSDFHGTAVASVIAGGEIEGVQIGIAPNVSLYDFRVNGKNGLIAAKTQARAIYKCIEQKVDVINISLRNYSHDEEFFSAISHAVASGIVVVAATSNEGIDYIGEPANIFGVITVNATNQNGLAEFSNYGWQTDISAPGEDIFACITQNDTKEEYTQKTGYPFLYLNNNAKNGNYTYISGVSIASPMVAGSVALLKSYLPTLNATEITNILLESTSKERDHSQYKLGNGQLNIANMALMAKEAKESEARNAGNIETLITTMDNTIYKAINNFYDLSINDALGNNQRAIFNYKLKEYADTDTLQMQVYKEGGVKIMQVDINIDRKKIGEGEDIYTSPLELDDTYTYENINVSTLFNPKDKTGTIKLFYVSACMEYGFDSGNYTLKLINKSKDGESTATTDFKILPLINGGSEVINIEEIVKNTDTDIDLTLDLQSFINPLPMEDKSKIALIAVNFENPFEAYEVIWEEDMQAPIEKGKLNIKGTLTKEMIQRLDAKVVAFMLARGNFTDDSLKDYLYITRPFEVRSENLRSGQLKP